MRFQRLQNYLTVLTNSNKVPLDVPDELGLRPHRGVTDPRSDVSALVKDTQQVHDMGFAYGVHLILVEKQMAKLKNALIACSVYVVSIVALYGLRETVSSDATGHVSRHWGAGLVGRDVIDVMSDTTSAVGGLYRHENLKPYTEGKGGTQTGAYSQVGSQYGSNL